MSEIKTSKTYFFHIGEYVFIFSKDKKKIIIEKPQLIHTKIQITLDVLEEAVKKIKEFKIKKEVK